MLKHSLLDYCEQVVNRLILQYKEYLYLNKKIKALENNKFAELLKSKTVDKVKEIDKEIELLKTDLDQVSNEMTFANPIIWMMYKYTAYKNTSNEISTLQDFRKHCEPEGYICTQRYRFLNNYLINVSNIDLNDKYKFPDGMNLSKLYKSKFIVRLSEDSKFMELWKDYEYHRTLGKVNKWLTGVPSLSEDDLNKFSSSMRTVYKGLAATLLPEEILKANNKKHDIKVKRFYSFGGLDFRVLPGVFTPGGTSENLFKFISNIESYRKKNILVVGTGAGVDTVLLAKKNPQQVTSIDIDVDSVKNAELNAKKHLTKDEFSKVKFKVSNLLANISDAKYDFIFFNPPAVSVPISDNQKVIRNTSVGIFVVTNLLVQIKNRSALNKNGKVYIILSNTAELKKIFIYALQLNYKIKIAKKITYPTPYKKIISYILEFKL